MKAKDLILNIVVPPVVVVGLIVFSPFFLFIKFANWLEEE